MSIFDDPSTTPDEAAPKPPSFMASTAGKIAVWAAVALTSAGVGAFIARQGSSARLTTNAVPGVAGINNGPPGGGFRSGAADDLAIAAKAIGISGTDLQSALQSGQSIAQVASAHGVSAQQVVDAIVAARKSALAAAVQSGQLTQAQADQVAANMTERITQRVNGTGFGSGPGGFGRGGGPPPAATRKV